MTIWPPTQWMMNYFLISSLLTFQSVESVCRLGTIRFWRHLPLHQNPWLCKRQGNCHRTVCSGVSLLSGSESRSILKFVENRKYNRFHNCISLFLNLFFPITFWQERKRSKYCLLLRFVNIANRQKEKHHTMSLTHLLRVELTSATYLPLGKQGG